MFNQNVPLLELSRATLPTHAAVPDHDKKRRIASLPEQVRGQPYLTVLYCTALYCTALHCTALHCTVLFWCLGLQPPAVRGAVQAALFLYLQGEL